MTESNDAEVAVFVGGQGPAPVPEWKTIPGFSAYQVSHRSCWTRGEDGTVYLLAGGVRSVDRTGRDGRPYKGAMVAVRTSGNGYPKANLVRDDGARLPVEVHVCVLTAHAGPCPPGYEARHLDDNPLNNVWAPGNEAETRAAGGNLIWGTRSENERDKGFNHPRPVRPPKPPKVCVRCGKEFTGPGRRDPVCRSTIAKQAAVLLRAGAPLESIAAHIDYPAEHVVTLAMRYGGYRHRPWQVTLRNRWRKVTRRDRTRGGDRP